MASQLPGWSDLPFWARPRWREGRARQARRTGFLGSARSSRLWIAIGGLSLALVGCGASPETRLERIASETCEELNRAVRLEIGLILDEAIEEAEELGFGGPDLGDALRSRCPDTMAAIEHIGQDRGSQRVAGVDGQENVQLELEGCFSDEARGIVTNNGDDRLTVFVEVQFLDEEDVLVGTGSDIVSGLRPGQTGQWTAHYFGDPYARCMAEISNVYED